MGNVDRACTVIAFVVHKEMAAETAARPPANFVHQSMLPVLHLGVFSPPEGIYDGLNCLPRFTFRSLAPMANESLGSREIPIGSAAIAAHLRFDISLM